MVNYTSLKSGNWGLRSDRELVVGSSVDVRKKDGAIKTEKVGSKVWSGDGVWLYAIESSRSVPSAGRRGRSSGAGYGRVDCRRYGWDGVLGSPSYYSSGQYDEDS